VQRHRLRLLLLQFLLVLVLVLVVSLFPSLLLAGRQLARRPPQGDLFVGRCAGQVAERVAALVVLEAVGRQRR